MKPSEESKAANGPARRIDPDKLVPVRDLLEPPPPPTKWRLGALALILLTIVLAAIGGPSPSASDGDAVTGQVTADGVEFVTDDRLELGFGGPVVVGVSDDLVDAGATEVEVTVSVSGITLPAGRTEPIGPVEDPDDVERFGFTQVAEIDSPLLGYLVGGPAEITVDVRDAAGTTLVSPTAVFEPERGGAVTIPNVLAFFVLLVVAVYTESFIRPMRRRGNRRLGSTIGLGIVGFLFGVSASVLGWTLLGAPLHLAWSLLVGIVGAAALVVLGISSAKRARRKRVEFIIEQQQLSQFFERAAA